MSKMIVVNLFGAPGAGKSTGAAYVFSMLKMLGVNVELVTEYAKDKVWEGNTEVFNNQAYIFGKQYYRLTRLKDKVDVVVTDSPLLLSPFYNKDKGELGEKFKAYAFGCFDEFDNMNYLLRRVKPYNPAGRFQTASESDILHGQLTEMFKTYKLLYVEESGDINGYAAIISDILRRLPDEFRKQVVKAFDNLLEGRI